MVVDIDRDVAIDTKGLPVCSFRQLAGRDVGAVRNACRSAIVGRGRADVEIRTTGPPSIIASPLTLFNGGTKEGQTKLFIHAFLDHPVPTARVGTVTIQRKNSGLDASVKIPVIAGGSGSILDFSLELGRKYNYKGKRASYAEARCPDSIFKVNMPSAVFRNEAHTEGVAAQTVLKGGLAVPCTPEVLD